MGIMITCHGYNNLCIMRTKNVGAHYTWQNTVFSLLHYKWECWNRKIMQYICPKCPFHPSTPTLNLKIAEITLPSEV